MTRGTARPPYPKQHRKRGVQLRSALWGPPPASLSSGQIAPGAGQCPHPQAPPQHPAAEPGPGRVVAAAVPSAPTEANIESFRCTSVCPLGQVTPPSASPIARRASKELWQSRQRYSYRAINTDPTGRVAVGAGRWRRRSPRRSRTSKHVPYKGRYEPPRSLFALLHHNS
jgi:hypothetical protein